MSVLQTVAGMGTNASSGVDIGDNIANSLMLDSASSQYLSRTAGTPTSNTVWTLSRWIKRGKLGTQQTIISAGVDANNYTECYFDTGNKIVYRVVVANAEVGALQSNEVFRDVGAHFQITLTKSGTTVTVKINSGSAPNGFTVTWTTIAAITSADTYINSAVAHAIGSRSSTIGVGNYGDWYDSNTIFVDGQALAASNFGRTSADTGQWVNKTYTGTYGNNGFKLNFSNSAALGTDSSGNGNNWTTNGGISSANQYTDTPTNSYCVANTLDKHSTITISKGNLAINASSGNRVALSTIGVSSGKWYFEGKFTGTMTGGLFGIAKANVDKTTYVGTDANGWAVLLGYSCAKITNNSGGGFGVAYIGTSALTGEVVCCALDMDIGKVWWRLKNGTWGGSAGGDPVAGTGEAFSGLTGPIFPAADGDSRGEFLFNFGANGFLYTPPTGFSALCTANLPTPAILKGALHFNAKTRTGNGGTATVSGELFQPDLVWTKGRSGATDHAIYDSVRGVQKQLESNTTSAESTETTGLTAFNSDGFTAGALAQMNTNTATYIDWMFKGGGVAVSGTGTGGLSSVTYSANTSAGISIVKATGNGTAGTITHGLGVAPKFIFAHALTNAGANWRVYHSGIGATKFLAINTTDAQTTNSTVWNDTAPTTSVFSVGTDGSINHAGGAVFYCFAEVEGFSKIGSYVGNASTDGTFVYCGFKPRLVLVKGSSGVGDWRLYDTARDTYNASGLTIYPNLANGEGDGRPSLDITSNGFKLRLAAYPNNAIDFVFIAIADTSIKYATGR